MILANNVRVGTLVLFGVALSLCLAGAFTPHQVRAAAVTLSSVVASSTNASTSLMKIGDTYKVQLDLSATPSATSTPIINIFNMGSTSFSGSGTRWTYSTTSVTQWTTGAITFVIGWGGTAGESTTTITQTSITAPNVVFDKTAPGISGITSSASCTGNNGACIVGDTLTFTLATSTNERFGSVTGPYNSASLTWTLTGVNTFVATYTVTEGQTDQSTALQISSVILSDAAGNTASGSGSDVAKTVDANTPATPLTAPAGGSFSGQQPITLSSVGSDSIYYTINGTTPSCSSGSVYSSTITATTTLTLKSLGCDTAGNHSSVSSVTYTQTGSSGGGGHSGGHSYVGRTTTPAPSFAPGSPTAGAGSVKSIIRNLQAGAVGVDVKTLQVFLNTHGFMISSSGPGSSGNETNTFGAKTRAALMKFQAAHGISPAAGFFGPKTRAAVSGM